MINESEWLCHPLKQCLPTCVLFVSQSVYLTKHLRSLFATESFNHVQGWSVYLCAFVFLVDNKYHVLCVHEM